MVFPYESYGAKYCSMENRSCDLTFGYLKPQASFINLIWFDKISLFKHLFKSCLIEGGLVIDFSFNTFKSQYSLWIYITCKLNATM